MQPENCNYFAKRIFLFILIAYAMIIRLDLRTRSEQVAKACPYLGKMSIYRPMVAFFIQNNDIFFKKIAFKVIILYNLSMNGTSFALLLQAREVASIMRRMRTNAS